MLLSFPFILENFTSDDARFAKAMFLRNQFFSVSKAVTYSGRQICYNIGGFKARKDKELSVDFSSAAISKFWMESVMQGNPTTGESLWKKTTVDNALTCYRVFFGVPPIDNIVQLHEKIYRDKSIFHELYRPARNKRKTSGSQAEGVRC